MNDTHYWQWFTNDLIQRDKRPSALIYPGIVTFYQSPFTALDRWPKMSWQEEVFESLLIRKPAILTESSDKPWQQPTIVHVNFPISWTSFPAWICRPVGTEVTAVTPTAILCLFSTLWERNHLFLFPYRAENNEGSLDCKQAKAWTTMASCTVMCVFNILYMTGQSQSRQHIASSMALLLKAIFLPAEAGHLTQSYVVNV